MADSWLGAYVTRCCGIISACAVAGIPVAMAARPQSGRGRRIPMFPLPHHRPLFGAGHAGAVRNRLQVITAHATIPAARSETRLTDRAAISMRCNSTTRQLVLIALGVWALAW